MKKIKLLLLVAVLISTFSVTAKADDFAVIVHSSNEFSSDVKSMKNEIRQLYLKQKFRWKNGSLSIPLGISDSNPAAKAFQEKVLDMSDSQLSSYWTSTKQSSGDSPPRKISSERLISRLVARDVGAFGIVSKEIAEKTQGIKILFTF